MSERIIRKWFWVWQFEKEEKWLNEMAEKGWALEGVGFCKYRFTACEPGEYAVRLELMEWHSNSEEGQDYIRFVEDTGAEFVGSQAMSAYFRRKKSEGEFDLFSDIDSRIGYIDRIIRIWSLMCLSDLVMGLMNIFRNDNFLRIAGILFILMAVGAGRGWYRLKQKKTHLLGERKLHE